MTRPATLPRIAIIDHHDSYTRNLLSLICTSVDETLSPELMAQRVVIIPHTHPALAPEKVHEHFLPFVDAIILSPGPGNPSNDGDFGASLRLLKNPSLVQTPVLGVCLGHQGIATTFGASVCQLEQPFHGRKRSLIVEKKEFERPAGMRSIMTGISDGTEVICYNSLVVDESTLPSCIRVLARSRLDSGPGTIVQAIEHIDLPYYGIQYHPESIESDVGQLVLNNFLHNVASYWNERDPSRLTHWCDQKCVLPPHLSRLGQSCVAPSRLIASERSTKHYELLQKSIPVRKKKPLEATLAYDMVPIVDRLFRRPGHEYAMGGCIWLDSASAKDPQSHMSMMSRAAFVLSYDMNANLTLSVQREDASVEQTSVEMADNTLWEWMSEIQWALQNHTVLPMHQNMSPGPGGRTCAFPAGFAGFWSYEMKDESLGLCPLQASRYEQAASKDEFNRMALPAAQWSFCNSVLCYDHHEEAWTASVLVRRETNAEMTPPVATLEAKLNQLPGASIGISRVAAEEWFKIVQDTLEDVCARPEPTTPKLASGLPPLHGVESRKTYTEKIQSAQDLIGQGESYELCLTTQFEGSLPWDTHNYDSYFSTYAMLRTKNPAPFGAYQELIPLDKHTPQAILSTSPERFLTVTRDGHLEMRPIKGTLVRPGWGKGEEEWLNLAQSDPDMQRFVIEQDECRKNALRADPKERAENLMIADLIRADLQAVCYPGSVQVPRLIALETYETVHQLVTAVTGKLRPGIGCVEATKRCFPPGSMTGAPKRRSVELLEQLERTTSTSTSACTRRRGTYSGAFGFIGLDGASNMSVVIRTVTTQGPKVMVGAGGAITVLSTAQSEWEEVLTKLSSVSSLAEPCSTSI